MKQELILTVLALSTIFITFYYITESELAKNSSEEEFFEFISKYNKNYNTYEEYEYRLEVFKHNLQKIDKLNQINPRAHFAVNKFADYDEVDMASILNSYHIQSKQRDFDSEKVINDLTRNDVKSVNSNSHQINGTKFEAVDWSGWFTTIDDQQNCSAGWAFATTAAFELMQSRREGHKKVITHYSEQQLIDCLYDFG